ncbi:MAG: MoaA/NifB/PqqE/SkfB family radical SAM enzyme [Planctomycetota bacterium]|jgi:MoaA/NifB/PqqE/SkfB family radical SAM enzyme
MGYLDTILTEAKKDRIAGDYPFSLGVEVTNHCNLRCPMCPRETADRGHDNMSWELYTKIADETAKHDRVLFLPQGFGESFIHPQFGKMLDYAHDVGVDLTMVVSNGTYLNTQNIHALIDAQVPFLNISLDGTNKEVFEKIRVNADYDKVVENVKELFRLRKERGSELPYIILRMIKMEETIDDVENFQNMWEPWLEEHDEVAFSSYQTWNNSVENKSVDQPVGLKELELIEGAGGQKPPCRMIYKTMQVYHDGSTTLCCYDYNCEMNVGNANENTVEELWTGEKAEHYRHLHEEGLIDEISICKGCQEYIP